MRSSLSLLFPAALAALPLVSIVAQDAPAALARAQQNGIASQRSYRANKVWSRPVTV